MKTKILSISLLLTAFYSFSQTLETLKSNTQKFYEANYLMDFETIVSFTYPKIVETKTANAVIIDELDLAYQNAEYRLRLQLETVPFQFGPIKKINGKSFCAITFRNPVRYFFETKLTSETAAEKKRFLQEINKTKEVTFEPNRNSFNVKKTTTFVAVIDETTANEWKFFNFDMPTQLDLFEVFFGKDTKKELGL